ncbi:MAG: T9SS type A sorting domain-containing protein, partial [FCB group bacterium]
KSISLLSEKNNLILGLGCNHGWVDSWYEINSGVIDIINTKDGKLIKNLTKSAQPVSVAISLNEKNFAYCAYTSRFDIRYNVGSGTRYNFYIDSNNNSHQFLDENGNPYDSFIDSMQFSKDGKYILGYSEGIYYIWNTSKMALSSSFTSDYDSLCENNINYVTFTQDSKYLLLAINIIDYYNGTDFTVIQLRDLNGKIVKDSIFVIDKNEYFIIRTIDNSTKFLIGGTDGILRLFDLTDFPVGIAETKQNQDNKIIYPIPAKDYIEIPNELIESREIIIYSIVGLKVLQMTTMGNRIDISSLIPGVYFVKVEQRVFKFVKL